MPAVHADERAEEFLKGLRDRGLEELSLDYLERMKTSSLASEAFRRRIPYERGVVLLNLSRKAADPAVRAERLAEARAQLEQFAAANPGSVEAAEAQIQIGGLLVELGRQSIAQAARLSADNTYKSQRDKLASDARMLYFEAGGMFQRVATVYHSDLDKSGSGVDANDNTEAGGRRKEIRARIAQAQYLTVTVTFEAAQTYPGGSTDNRRLLEAAAKEFATLSDQYASASIWGYYARLDEGRCYQALRQFQLALGCFQDVIARSASLVAFRPLVSRAYSYQAECLTAQNKFDAAIQESQQWLNNSTEDELKQSEWLAVRFQLAEALRRKAEQQTANSAESKRLLTEARNAYRVVADVPGAHQPAARTSFVALKPAEGAQRSKPKSFTEAYELGRDALANSNSAKQAIPLAEKNNPSAVAELKTQIEEGNDEARHYLELATTLAEDDTDRATLNQVRYFLSWLYWEDQDYFRAAVMGDFLAQRYPDHAAAAAAARIALAAYERLEQESVAANPNDRAASEFAARHAAETAEFVTRRWPGTKEAEAAVAVLVRYAIRNNRVEDAQKLLANVSADARPQLELQLGMSMWARYAELSQRDDANRPSDASLRQLKEAAIEYLSHGVDAARKADRINESTTAASIYLIQALLGRSDYNGAIKLLEDEKSGPLTLVAKQHPAAARQGFAIQVYETALRVYVAANPPRTQKVLETMQLLEKSINDGGGQLTDSLTRVYVTLGVQLQQQIDQLRSAERDDDAERVSAAFAEFVDRIAARKDGLTWATRQWVAQSYYRLGALESDAGGDVKRSDKQKEYLNKARDLYKNLLDTAAIATPPPSENTLLAAKFQYGECLRESGQFEQALDIFSVILQDKESTLSVQQAAALALQQRGQAGGVDWFERAIFGHYKLKATGENRVWGWHKISQVADRASRNEPKFRDTFFEARLNIARCRYYAALQQEGDGRKQSLASAKQNIQSVLRAYPDGGGPKWKAAFEGLSKDVDKATTETSPSTKSATK